MSVKKKIAFGMSVVLLAGACFSGCGAEESVTSVQFENQLEEAEVPETEVPEKNIAEFDKEETVQVEADAAGNVKKITVETRLKGGAGDTIPDYTLLTDLKNTEGDEEFTKASDGNITWQNHGEDIRYEGTMEADLPVALKITYELDGRRISPEQLAGRSGKLRMRFDYENRLHEVVAVNGKDVEVCIPFTAFTLVMLPEDVFSDVKVENGKIISMGDDKMVAGYAFPGLADSLRLEEMEDLDVMEIPDYVEITAQVRDFKLDFTATVVSTGAFEDFDPEDLNEIEELIGDMDELEDASKELVDAAGELKDGVEEFGDYLQEYVDAVATVKEGTAGMQQGIGALNKNKKTLLEGAQALQEGLEDLQEAMNGAAAGAGGSGDDGSGSSGADMAALLTDMKVRLAKLEANLNPEDTAAQEEIDGLKNDIAVLSNYMAAMGNVPGSMAELAGAVDQLATGSAQLTTGIQAFNDGITKLYKASEKFNDGVGEIKNAGTELTDGYQELIDGVGEFRDGVKEFDEEGIRELADFAGEDLQNLVDRLRAVKEADGRYINFGGILPGKTGSVRFIIETEEIK